MLASRTTAHLHAEQGEGRGSDGRWQQRRWGTFDGNQMREAQLGVDKGARAWEGNA